MLNISTVVMHSDLYKICSSFFPDSNKLIIDGSKGLYSLDALIIQLKYPIDEVILVDEDMFISDKETFIEWVEYCRKNKVAVSGVPDGGVDHRNHNPVSPNNFLVYLNLKMIRESNWEKCIIDMDKVKLLCPKTKHNNYNFDLFEPYYQVYLRLALAGLKFFYLDAEIGEDGLTTIPIFKDKKIGYHSWYSRAWNQLEHRERIKKVINNIK